MKKISKRYSNEAIIKNRKNNYLLWLKKVKDKYPNKFDYSFTENQYKTQKFPKIEIICKDHGKIKITPDKHVQDKGGGCKKCGLLIRSETRLNNQEKIFFDFFNKKFLNKLIICSEYKGSHKIIKVKCLIHPNSEEDKTTPNNLMHGKAFGCNLCARENNIKASRLKLVDVHKYFDDILPPHVKIINVFFDSKSNQSKILIDCKYDGVQPVTKGYLTRRDHYCPKCGLRFTGYAGTRIEKLLYEEVVSREIYICLIKIKVDNIYSLKIGVTSRAIEKRYSDNLIKIIFIKKLPEIQSLIIEELIKRKFVKLCFDKRILLNGVRKGKRWVGDTECFKLKYQKQILGELNKIMREIKKGNIDFKKIAKEMMPFTGHI